MEGLLQSMQRKRRTSHGDAKECEWRRETLRPSPARAAHRTVSLESNDEADRFRRALQSGCDPRLEVRGFVGAVSLTAKSIRYIVQHAQLPHNRIVVSLHPTLPLTHKVCP